MDSSSEDEGTYQTTNVTLGYASKIPTDDEISHIGGHPTWLDAQITPPAALSKCKSCNGLTSLLLQLHADLASHFPQDDRRLHVFCCRKKTCSKKIGSIRAFREVRKPQARAKAASVPSPAADSQAKQGLGTALFGGTRPTPTTTSANPFSATNGKAPQQLNPFSSAPPTSSLAAMPPQQPVEEPKPLTSTFAEKLRIGDDEPTSPAPPSDSWPGQDAFPAPFMSYYLDADAEELEPERSSHTGQSGSSKSQYDIDDANTGASDKDNFESAIDKTFQKFSDRMSQNPVQVLRYEFKGQPLLSSGTDDVASRFVVPHGKAGAPRGIPRCESCGSQRIFELQLVPGLIYELEKDEAMDFDDGMEWGTIIVATCANNCGDAGSISFKEEWVGVQWEERLPHK